MALGFAVMGAGREVAEALHSQRLMPLPQQRRRKGQTEAQPCGLVQTPQKPQFSGAGCCTVRKLHIYGLLLYCSVMWFNILCVFLSAKWGCGKKKISLTSEMCIFHVLEGTPQMGKFPTKKIYVHQ